MNIDSKFHKKFEEDMRSMGLFYYPRKLDAIIEYLGPSIHNKDASLVACSDKNETHYIKEKFLVGKLGLDADDPRLDKAIDKVCELMGSDNSHKNRVTFYYMLMAILQVKHTALKD
ncbi:MAG: DUF2853 family protein [bacterium]|nr:DUF2853 family protein [bacterium]